MLFSPPFLSHPELHQKLCKLWAPLQSKKKNESTNPLREAGSLPRGGCTGHTIFSERARNVEEEAVLPSIENAFASKLRKEKRYTSLAQGSKPSEEIEQPSILASVLGRSRCAGISIDARRTALDCFAGDVHRRCWIWKIWEAKMQSTKMARECSLLVTATLLSHLQTSTQICTSAIGDAHATLLRQNPQKDVVRSTLHMHLPIWSTRRATA